MPLVPVPWRLLEWWKDRVRVAPSHAWEAPPGTFRIRRTTRSETTMSSEAVGEAPPSANLVSSRSVASCGRPHEPAQAGQELHSGLRQRVAAGARDAEGPPCLVSSTPLSLPASQVARKGFRAARRRLTPGAKLQCNERQAPVLNCNAGIATLVREPTLNLAFSSRQGYFTEYGRFDDHVIQDFLPAKPCAQAEQSPKMGI
jgi:hypothetical protein